MSDQSRVPEEGIVPLEGESLGTAVYTALRMRILEGSIPPGTRIVEESLAKELGISRAPLREAIWLLKRDGLLVEESARTTRVVTLSSLDVRELHLTRTLLETVAYQHAAKRITTAEIDGVREVLAKMQAAVDAGDKRQLAVLDYEFHRDLCHASGLPRLVEMWERQQILFRLWLNLVGATIDDTHDHIVQSHGDILDTVLGGDDDQIFEHVLKHVYLVGSALGMERLRWATLQPRVTSPLLDFPALKREHNASQEAKQ
jgi:DNA-binding GntR family transcriptional regulator